MASERPTASKLLSLPDELLIKIMIPEDTAGLILHPVQQWPRTFNSDAPVGGTPIPYELICTIPRVCRRLRGLFILQKMYIFYLGPTYYNMEYVDFYKQMSLNSLADIRSMEIHFDDGAFEFISRHAAIEHLRVRMSDDVYTPETHIKTFKSSATFRRLMRLKSLVALDFVMVTPNVLNAEGEFEYASVEVSREQEVRVKEDFQALATEIVKFIKWRRASTAHSGMEVGQEANNASVGTTSTRRFKLVHSIPPRNDNW